MSFKAKVYEIVNEYQRQMGQLNYAIEIIKGDTCYSEEGKQKKINEINETKQNLDKLANEYLTSHISEFITAHRPAEPTKDNDYELKVSNALKMIELLGNNLTDETTSQLLDFNMDSKQSGIFRTILENRCPNSWQFHQTFKKLDDAAELLSAATRLQESAAGLFNYTRPYSPSDIRIGDIEYYANVINPPAE
jgi:hypothetical protein